MKNSSKDILAKKKENFKTGKKLGYLGGSAD